VATTLGPCNVAASEKPQGSPIERLVFRTRTSASRSGSRGMSLRSSQESSSCLPAVVVFGFDGSVHVESPVAAGRTDHSDGAPCPNLDQEVFPSQLARDPVPVAPGAPKPISLGFHVRPSGTSADGADGDLRATAGPRRRRTDWNGRSADRTGNGRFRAPVVPPRFGSRAALTCHSARPTIHWPTTPQVSTTVYELSDARGIAEGCLEARTGSRDSLPRRFVYPRRRGANHPKPRVEQGPSTHRGAAALYDTSPEPTSRKESRSGLGADGPNPAFIEFQAPPTFDGPA